MNYKIETSARHLHISEKDFIALFGEGAELNNEKDLSIVGEFKSDKSVTLVGQKRNIERVSILGPFRDQTQVEISRTDCFTLGIKNVPTRMSGDLAGSAPITLRAGGKEITLNEGLMVAGRHIHLSDKDAKDHSLKDGDIIDITAGDMRKATFHNVVVRISNVRDCSIVHIDTDESNAIN